jgi:hypothetical protein
VLLNVAMDASAMLIRLSPKMLKLFRDAFAMTLTKTDALRDAYGDASGHDLMRQALHYLIVKDQAYVDAVYLEQKFCMVLSKPRRWQSSPGCIR